VLVLTRNDLSENDGSATDLQLRPDLDRDTFTIEFTTPQSVYYVKEPQRYGCNSSSDWRCPILHDDWTSKICLLLKLLVIAPKPRCTLLL